MTEECSGPVVEHDSDRLVDDLRNDKIGILSPEGAHAAGQPGQGDGLERSPDCGVETPQKAPNEANLGSTQSVDSQRVESEKPEPPQPERSQFAAGGQPVPSAAKDRDETIVRADQGGGKTQGRKGPSLLGAVLATRAFSGRRGHA